MDQIQQELTDEGLEVSIIGVNDVGFESGNDTITDGRNIPWLQNTAEVDAWNLWEVQYRDVVIVDRDGVQADVFNVTENDLSQPDTYERLKTILRGLATN